MYATTAGAVKAALEAANLGLAWYADRTPDNTGAVPTFPYGVIHAGISVVSGTAKSSFAKGTQQPVRETVQVSIWQAWKKVDNTGKRVSWEDPALVENVVNALDGTRLLTTGPNLPVKHIYGVAVTSTGPRLLDFEAIILDAQKNPLYLGTIHTPITVEIDRDR